MSDALRRSWLLVPASKPDRIAQAAMSGADVVVLDLVELVAEEDKHAARETMQAALATVRAQGPAVYAMIDPELMYADLTASVWPQLHGVVVARTQSAETIQAVDALLAQLEAKRGLLPGSVKIVAALETAQGNHNAYEIARASARVGAVTLGRADLIMDLRPEPSGEIHLLPYLMQRLILIANAAGVTPLGAWWRGPDRGLAATAANTYAAAHRGCSIGFKGSLCLRIEQVEPLNRAYARG